MRRLGHDDLVARAVAARAVVSADHGDPGELALRPGHRRERHAFHAGDRLEHLLQLVQAREESLALRLRGERMAREKLRQHRVLVTGPGVVLHRARAERIEVRVDGEVQLRQAREVTHRLELAHFRQLRGTRAALRRRQVGERRGARMVRPLIARAATRLRVLEDDLVGYGHAKAPRGVWRKAQRPQAARAACSASLKEAR
jgi:hypothetical protein